MALIMSTYVDPPRPKNFHLGPDSFSIGQDKSMSVLIDGSSAPTTVKRDYVRWGSGHAVTAIPPPPADVIACDLRYFNTRKSEMRAEYDDIVDAAAAASVDKHKMRATNFKMDSDLKHFNFYESTNKLTYGPKKGRTCRYRKDLMASHIPQGDMEKVKHRDTDYSLTYQPHDTRAHKPARANCLHYDTSLATKWDSRKRDFNTTQKDEFHGHHLPRVAPFHAPTGTNVPMGDPQKEMTLVSDTTDNYQPPDAAALNQDYNTAHVSAMLRRTNFKQKDGRESHYMSTMKEAFLPQTLTPYEKIEPKYSSYHDDLPEGDSDPRRAHERVNITTNTASFRNHQASKPTIVKGADISTKSKVSFGDPAKMADFYGTTNDATYDTKTSSYTPKGPSKSTKSSLQMHPYDGPVNCSTYRASFLDPDSGKMYINPAAHNSLLQSHIRMPLVGDNLFMTDYKETFVRLQSPKKHMNKLSPYHSSLPIGTLKQ